MTETRRDPSNQRTINALAYLTAAQFAREQYDRLLRHAIGVYGDRHIPDKIGGRADDVCTICRSRGIVQTAHERLNHQSGSLIAGIYSDHFPDRIKDSLRLYATLIGEQSQLALQSWVRAGRKASTFRDISQQYRTLSGGRLSFY